MKTRMDYDEFAEFMAKIIFKIDNYNFDVLYDIKTIMTEFAENRSKTDKAIFSTYHLLIRNSGCDLIKPDDENYNLYENRNSKVYCLQFCWNRDYFNIPFCIMNEIK